MTDKKLIDYIDSFKDLPENWNSYGAKPTTSEAITTAKALLKGLTVVPRNNGGIQIEIWGKIFDVEPTGEVKINDD